MVTAETIRQALRCGQPGCKCGTSKTDVHCPVHNSNKANFSVSEKDDKILVKCHVGCSQGQVIEALKARDLWPSPNGNGAQAHKSRIVATYDYHDAAGKLIFQVCRKDNKEFPQRRPDGKDGWIWNLDGVDRVPYRLPELLKAETVFIAEGEKDCDRLVAMGFPATCNPGGAEKWRPEYNPHFQGKAVVIFPDNDPPGKAHALDVARNLHGVAASVKIVELPGLPEKGDVSDWIKAGGTKAGLLALAEGAPEWGQPAQVKKPTLKPFTARELGTKEFPEPRWAIPDLIPEGLTILGGRPKIGKSWFALNLAVAAATGGMALGKIPVEKGECLYLALEDTPRRLKERLGKIIPFGDLPDTLHFITANDFPLLFKGGLDALSAWLTEHPQARLLVIDTLARIKPPKGKNVDSYDHDSQIMSALQGLAALHQLALIVVAHTKKGKEDDFLANILGSTGQTGVADCVAELTRKARGQMDGILKLTGRDIEEQELAMRFDPDLGLWELLGEAQEFGSSQERQDILLILREVGPKKPAQLAKIMDKSSASIRYLLFKMKESGQVRDTTEGYISNE